LCEYQKRDLSKTIFTPIPQKVTLNDPAIGPLSEFSNFCFSREVQPLLKIASETLKKLMISHENDIYHQAPKSKYFCH